jgi:glycosyltransferase involved in cell wall biosynthesis
MSMGQPDTGRNRNVGVQQSCSDLIAFLDDDDVWLPDKMERQLRYMERNQLDFLATSALYRRKNSGRVSIRPSSTYSSRSGSVYWHLYSTLSFFGNRAYIPTPSFLVKKDVALAHPFNENYPYFEDIDWLQRLYVAGSRMDQLPDPLVEISASPRRSSRREDFAFNQVWITKLQEEDRRLAVNFVRFVAVRSALLGNNFTSLVRYCKILMKLLKTK